MTGRPPSPVVVLGVLCAAVAACAGPSEWVAGEWKQVKAHTLGPGGVHEECATLQVGERLEYAFTSSTPVAFNIHYHEGNAVIQPITREGTREERGAFAAPIPHEYCLMWEAGREGALLDYRVRLREPR